MSPGRAHEGLGTPNHAIPDERIPGVDLLSAFSAPGRRLSANRDSPAKGTLSMSRPFFQAVVLAALVAGSAQAQGSVTLAPISLPSAKLATQELKGAFGKQWENAIRDEVKGDLVAAHVFTDVVPEGGDLTFTLDLQDARRSFDDRVKISGWGVLTFAGSGRFSWSRAGSVVSEGSFDVSHVVRIERSPWRTDLTAGWREVFHKAVVDAVAHGHEGGVLKSDAPGTSR